MPSALGARFAAAFVRCSEKASHLPATLASSARIAYRYVRDLASSSSSTTGREVASSRSAEGRNEVVGVEAESEMIVR
jgi:hypothetical protein